MIDLNAGTIVFDDAAGVSHSQTISTAVVLVDASAQLDADVDFTVTGNAAGITVTTGYGDDTFAFAAAGAADTVKITDNNGADTITTFVNGEDKLDFTLVTAAGALAKVAITNAAADNSFTVDGTNTTVYVIDTDGDHLGNSAGKDIANFTTMANVASFLNDGVTASNVANEVHYFFINDATAAASYLYKFIDGGTNTSIAGGELTLIGTLTTDGSATTAADIGIA